MELIWLFVLFVCLGIMLAVWLERILYLPYRVNRLSYHLALQNRSPYEGEDVVIEESIHNKGILPFPLIVTEIEIFNYMDEKSRFLHMGENYQSYQWETSLLFFQKTTRKYTVPSEKRGVHKVWLNKFWYHDLLMMSKHLLQIDHSGEEWVVFPRIYPIDQLIPLPNTYSGEKFIRRFILEDVFYPSGVRPYTARDDIRFIDWKRTARQGELMTKTFDYTSQDELFIILNMQTSNTLIEGTNIEWTEEIIRIGASLIHSASKENFTIGLFANAGCIGYPGQTLVLPPKAHQGIDHLYELTARLLNYPSQFFDIFISNQSRYWRPEGNIIVVTAFIDNDISRALWWLRGQVGNLKILLLGDSVNNIDTGTLPIIPVPWKGENIYG